MNEAWRGIKFGVGLCVGGALVCVLGLLLVRFYKPILGAAGIGLTGLLVLLFLAVGFALIDRAAARTASLPVEGILYVVAGMMGVAGWICFASDWPQSFHGTTFGWIFVGLGVLGLVGALGALFLGRVGQGEVICIVEMDRLSAIEGWALSNPSVTVKKVPFGLNPGRWLIAATGPMKILREFPSWA